MVGGCAAALRQPDIGAALTGGPLHATLCAVLLWSARDAHEVLVDWTRIDHLAALEGFAAAVESVPRVVRAGNTAIDAARAEGLLMNVLSFRMFRRVSTYVQLLSVLALWLSRRVMVLTVRARCLGFKSLRTANLQPRLMIAPTCSERIYGL